MSAIAFTLRRSSKALAIAYRTNSDLDGNPCSLDVSASSFACSFVSLRLMVSTRCSNTWVLLSSADSRVLNRHIPVFDFESQPRQAGHAERLPIGVASSRFEPLGLGLASASVGAETDLVAPHRFRGTADDTRLPLVLINRCIFAHGMKVTKISAMNFRSIRGLTLDLTGFDCFVG